MDTKTCEYCDIDFTPKRCNARFCCDKCRKQAHQKSKRKTIPVNARNSREERRREAEIFERHMRIAEMYYTRPPRERPMFLVDLIRLAREGNSKVKRIILNRVFLRPDPDEGHKFWRGSRMYPTLAQEAHLLCKQVVGVGIEAVVKCDGVLFDRLAATDDRTLEAALTSSACPTEGREVVHVDNGAMSGLAFRAYEAALASAGVSVVRTERRNAA